MNNSKTMVANMLIETHLRTQSMKPAYTLKNNKQTMGDVKKCSASNCLKV